MVGAADLCLWRTGGGEDGEGVATGVDVGCSRIRERGRRRLRRFAFPFALAAAATICACSFSPVGEMSVELCGVCRGAEMRVALTVAWRPRRRRRNSRAMATIMKTTTKTLPITPPIIPPMELVDECEAEGWEVDEELVSVVDVVVVISCGKGNISPYPLVGLHSTYVKVAPGSLSVEYAYVKQYGLESEQHSVCGPQAPALGASPYSIQSV